MSNFYDSLHSDDGKLCECKSCINSKQRIKNRHTERKCSNCKIIKPIEEFGRHANNSRRMCCLVCYDKITPQEQKRRDFLSLDNHKRLDRIYKTSNCRLLMLKNARLRARKKNLDFNIELIDIIIPNICPVLGIEIKQNIGKSGDFSPSLDRVDNGKGYIKGNIRVISHKANSIKRDGKLEDFKMIINYIVTNSDIDDYSI